MLLAAQAGKYVLLIVLVPLLAVLAIHSSEYIGVARWVGIVIWIGVGIILAGVFWAFMR